MARTTAHPLTTEQAKLRLREVAQRADWRAWVQQHPYQAVAAGLLGGVVVGRLVGPTQRLGRLASNEIITLAGLAAAHWLPRRP